jgi:hypothetical protein
MPKQSTSKGATVQVRVSGPMKQSIDRYAEARGMSVGEFVRYCVWTYMDSAPPDEAAEFDEPLTGGGASERAIELGEVRHG